MFARSDGVKGMENNASSPRHGLLTGSFVLTNGTSGERLAREGGGGGGGGQRGDRLDTTVARNNVFAER